MTDSSQPLPNKCDHCGLRVFMWHRNVGSAGEADAAFSDLHRLKNAGIISSVPRRRVGASIGGPFYIGEGTTSFCAVNASAWSNRATGCKHWQLKMDAASLSDYLAIYHANRNQEIATGLAVLAIVITVVISIVQLST